MLTDLIPKLARRQDLTRDEAGAAADAILEGKQDEDTVARFLVALAEKGEIADEIAGFASALMRRAVRVEAPPDAVDLCGTGGSGLPRFNVSTAAAFAVAACGVPVAKHGNKGSRQPDGSFDLIENLGLPVELSPAQAAEALRNVGLAFLFARAYHPIMKNVVGARKKAGRRTIFNLVGPLCNPAGVSVQVIGTADRAKLEELGKALQILGRRRAVVVRGEPGIDEFSISGASEALEVTPGGLRRFRLLPEECGITPCAYDSLLAGRGPENAGAFRDLLEGKAPESLREIVALNAGAVLYVAGRVSSIADGCQEARRCMSDGRLKRKYDDYSRFVKRPVGS
jgi:anthranilate phosphoribosyltransferase